MLRTAMATSLVTVPFGIVFGVALVFGYGGIGAWEGRHWPVASPMELAAAEADGAGGTMFSGRFAVLRAGQCRFRAFDWRLGLRGAPDVPVEVDAGAPVVRPGGPAEFTGWRVNIPPAEFTRSHADVLHDCGWPWLTRTAFWN